ncbi:MAG: hypothetical protein R3300_06460, partial [Candidatus Promineifilaceae bacterium]|nr:hypothetical protein [Candidatus Promineifilaceae bacterium]
EHVIYWDPNGGSGPSYVKGYAVPLALIVSPEVADGVAAPDEMDDRLLARLGLENNKKGQADSRILLSCLPSLSRLRGRAATRWFAPSDCPDWHR